MDAIMPNLTFLYQLIFFIVALVVIKYFILNPLADILKRRNERIAGADAEALRLREESEKLDEKYRERIRDARAQAKLDRAQEREKAQAEERQILGKGRQEAQAKLQAIVAEIQKESQAARERLKADAVQISNLFAEKLLGRSVS
jgi:F-type H+-transporting ATPase subunit b